MDNQKQPGFNPWQEPFSYCIIDFISIIQSIQLLSLKCLLLCILQSRNKSNAIIVEPKILINSLGSKIVIHITNGLNKKKATCDQQIANDNNKRTS